MAIDYRFELNDIWSQLWTINTELRRLTRNNPPILLEHDHVSTLLSAKDDVVKARDKIKAVVDSIDNE